MARTHQVEDPGPKASGKVWEADPLLCPKCQKEMRIVSLIDERAVIERILRHLGLMGTGCARLTGEGAA